MQKSLLFGVLTKASGSSHSAAALLQENPLSQHAGAKNSFEGQCSAHKVERLLQELRGHGIDLEAFEPDQLFEQIKGRTLWFVPIPYSSTEHRAQILRIGTEAEQGGNLALFRMQLDAAEGDQGMAWRGQALAQCAGKGLQLD